MAMAARAMAMAMDREGNGNGGKSNGNSDKECKGKGGKVWRMSTRVAGNKEGNGEGSDKSVGNGIKEGIYDGGKSDGNGDKEGKSKCSKGNDNGDKGVRQGTVMARKRAMATATRVAGNKESAGYGYCNCDNNKGGREEEGNNEGGLGNGNGDKKGNDNRLQQHGQWLQGRGWRAFDSSDNGNRDADSMKVMAACATIGEREMMVAMGHGLCVCFGVCGETTNNKVGPKKSQCFLGLIA